MSTTQLINPQLQDRLLAWAQNELRDLPWRDTRDPWCILVSETMLQQTQVSRVIDRYHEFLTRFPTPAECAASSSAAVIELWAGLGYNRRAVNLWRAAVEVTESHGGQLPNDLAALLALPGVGPYTARAIQVFAFEQDIGVVDTNVGRLLARWTGASLAAKDAQHLADAYVPAGQAWLWSQGLFDFAVATCTKKEPACATCPISQDCVWQGSGDDPAVSSAFVSAKQSKFEGSKRQVRGRIVNALRSGPIPATELGEFGRPDDTEADVVEIARGLVADRLAVECDGFFSLPS